MVARQVIASPGQLPIAFSIAVDPGVIDPADTYVVKAAVVDGTQAWAGLDGVPAVENGTLLTDITVAVAPTELPSQPPAATPEPTAEPTAKPTPEPTPEPTAKPTPEADA